MKTVCVCCGAYGPVEQHHVGGRKYSEILVSVCRGCHFALSGIEMERRWSDAATPAARIIVGTLDILTVMMQRSISHAAGGEFVTELVTSMTGLARTTGLFTVRPLSRAVTVTATVADRLYDYDRYIGAVQLLRDVAAYLVTSNEPECVRTVAAAVQVPDREETYRRMSVHSGRATVSGLLAEMVVVCGQTLLNVRGDDGLPADSIGAMFRHVISRYQSTIGADGYAHAER